MVHLSRFRDRTRKVAEISEVLGVENGEVLLAPLFVFREEGARNGRIEGTLERTDCSLRNTEKLRLAGKEVVTGGKTG
jgi:pilus assembly protein CpaF